MKSANIPHLYIRNGIYYYRNNSLWKSLKTRCKKEAFKKICNILCDKDNRSLQSKPNREKKPLKLSELIKAYMKENSPRWCARECSRINSVLALLPDKNITKEIAIQLKLHFLKSKTATTFNRYLKYFNAFYRWLIANNSEIDVNPFDGLKVIEKKTSMASKRNAYSPEQLKTLFEFANKFSKSDPRFWLIMIGRYTGARMNEICQLKPDDITKECIYIRGEILKTENSKRTIPIHSKLIELGILDWVSSCRTERLFSKWSLIKGSYSHQASRWFSRNNPFKSGKKGEKAIVDFHSLRHTVATELKGAGVPSQYAAQILGHNNGNITYDRYGKSVKFTALNEAVNVIGSVV